MFFTAVVWLTVLIVLGCQFMWGTVCNAACAAAADALEGGTRAARSNDFDALAASAARLPARLAPFALLLWQHESLGQPFSSLYVRQANKYLSLIGVHESAKRRALASALQDVRRRQRLHMERQEGAGFRPGAAKEFLSS